MRAFEPPLSPLKESHEYSNALKKCHEMITAQRLNGNNQAALAIITFLNSNGSEYHFFIDGMRDTGLDNQSIQELRKFRDIIQSNNTGEIVYFDEKIIQEALMEAKIAIRQKMVDNYLSI